MTQQEADALFDQDVNKHLASFNSVLRGIGLRIDEIATEWLDALFDFHFNRGLNSTSQTYQLLQDRDFEGLATNGSPRRLKSRVIALALG